MAFREEATQISGVGSAGRKEGVSAEALRWGCAQHVSGKQDGCGSRVGEKEWRKSQEHVGSHG